MIERPAQFKKYRRLIGHRVAVTGKLFHAHTGHHHKQLLLSVSEIENRPWQDAEKSKIATESQSQGS